MILIQITVMSFRTYIGLNWKQIYQKIIFLFRPVYTKDYVFATKRTVNFLNIRPMFVQLAPIWPIISHI